MRCTLFFAIVLLFSVYSNAGTIEGKVTFNGQPVPWCVVMIEGTALGTHTDDSGMYVLENVAHGAKIVCAVAVGYQKQTQSVLVQNQSVTRCNFELIKVGDLGEVVITEISGKTILKENPLPISVVSAEKINGGTGANVVDVLSKNTPGLQVVKTGPNISKPFINGLGYNRVLTMVDGMRLETQQWGEEHGVPIDDYAVQKAEVIKGPASLLFGSDALGGVVGMTTFTPTDSSAVLKSRIVSEFQTNNKLSGTSLLLTRGNSKWGWNTILSHRIAGNFSNSIDGKVYNTGFQSVNGGAKLRRNFSNGFAELAVNYHQNRQGVPDGSRDSISRAFTRQVYELGGVNSPFLLVDDIKNRPIVSNEDLNAYKLSDLSQFIGDLGVSFSSRLTFKLGVLNTNIGVERNRRIEFNHPTRISQPGMNVRLLSGQFRSDFATNEFKSMQFNIGLCGMLQNNRNLDATDFPIPDYTLYDAGLYALTRWKKNRWTFSGGIRFDYRMVAGEQMFTVQNAVTGFRTQTVDTVGATRQFDAFKLNFSGVTGSLGGTYRLTNAATIKANIGKGYRAPNITEIASQGLDPGAHIYYIGNLGFKPEFNVQGDLALLFSSRNFELEAGGFYNTISGFIYQDVKTDASGNPLVIVPGNRTFQYQQTNADLMGGQLRVAYAPKSHPWFSTEHQLSCVYGFNRAGQYRGMGVNGEYLPFIPPVTVRSNVQLQWIDLKRQHKNLPMLNIESEWIQAQDRYFGLYNTETYTPGYFLVNLQMSGHLSVFKDIPVYWIAGVNNIGDVAYQNHLSRLKYFEYYTNSPNGHLGIYDMGRNFCLKVIIGKVK